MSFPDWSSNDLQRRMRDYAMRSTTIIGEGFAILRNEPLSHEERNRYTFLGFAAPNIDDLTDQTNANPQQLKALVTVPGQFFTLHQVELICAEFLKNCYSEMPFPSQTKHIFTQLIEAQLESQRQKIPTASIEQIRSITYNKGGFSVQLFNSLLDHKKSDKELQSAMQLGYLIQLLDDWFDMFIDQKEQVQTLANILEIDHFIHLFESEWKKLKKQIHNTSYAKRQKKGALNHWYIFFSTAFMFHGQLKRNGIKNLNKQPELAEQPISLRWKWPDILDGIERGLKENFSK